MSAYFETGFSVRKPMWHGQGNVLTEYPDNWDDARLAAGLMWEPAYRDVFADPITVAVDQVIEHPEFPGRLVLRDDVHQEVRPIADTERDGKVLVLPVVDGFRRIVRDDTGATLAVPTDSYSLIQHHQMGELLDAYTEAWRKAGAQVKFETVGALKGGRLVWALVYLDEPYTVPGDESETFPFAALLNPHDGSGAAKLLPTQVRIVCWNTWNAASMIGDRTGNQVIIRHVGNVSERIEEAKITLATMRDEAKEWQMIAADLAAINVSDALVSSFLDEFIPIPENAAERTRNARERSRATFRKLYNESPTTDGVRGNAYGLVQTAGEYLDHLRPFRSQDTYLARTMFQPEPIKKGVVKLVRELVAEGV